MVHLDVTTDGVDRMIFGVLQTYTNCRFSILPSWLCHKDEKAVCFKLSDIASSTCMRIRGRSLQQTAAVVYQIFPCHPAHVVLPISAKTGRPEGPESVPGRNG